MKNLNNLLNKNYNELTEEEKTPYNKQYAMPSLHMQLRVPLETYILFFCRTRYTSQEHLHPP